MLGIDEEILTGKKRNGKASGISWGFLLIAR